MINIKYDKLKKCININIYAIHLNISTNIQKHIVKLLKPVILLLDSLIPKDNKKIVFNSYPNFSDNAYAYYKYLIEKYPNKYNYIWISLDAFLSNEININHYDLYTFKAIWHMLTAKYIVSTHSGRFTSFLQSKKHIYLNLWHGMPIKTIGYTERIKSKKVLKGYDFLAERSHMFATSDIFKQLFISSFKIDYDKVHITGHAKNDIIFDNTNNEKIKEIFNFKSFNKVIFYLPTYKNDTGMRKKQVSKTFNNIFYMDDFEETDFIKFLEDNNYLFIIKPHPMEENLYKNYKKSMIKTNHIKLVNNNFFIKENFNFYEMFKYIDLMISDFSSVTIDYLILNKPIIYLDNLSDEYQTLRGTVLEDNYDLLMPGAKVHNYNDLKTEIVQNLTKDNYKELRTQRMPLLNKYTDGHTCERIYKIMQEL